MEVGDLGAQRNRVEELCGRSSKCRQLKIAEHNAQREAGREWGVGKAGSLAREGERSDLGILMKILSWRPCCWELKESEL